MKIEERRLDGIFPYERNPRKHGKGIDKIAASLREFGFRQPIVVDADGVIVAGHGRYQAAMLLGLETAPVHVAEDLTEEQAKAYRIADNRSNEESVWDEYFLSVELADLEDCGFDLAGTGLNPEEVDAFMEAGGDEGENDEATEEEVPDLPEEAVTQLGDVYVLGDHRLVCGDSLAPASYGLLMGEDELADMVYTDPPYNVDYEGALTKRKKIKNDNMGEESYCVFMKSVLSNLSENTKKNAPFYISYADCKSESFYKAIRESDLIRIAGIIWVKNHFVLGMFDYHTKHEMVWYGYKRGGKRLWNGGRKQHTVDEVKESVPIRERDGKCIVDLGEATAVISGDNIRVEIVKNNVVHEDKPSKSDLHPTIKPIRLLKRFIKNSSRRGDVVLDGFGGSGSTMIACEALGRKARLIEIDPKYCDVIVKRWEDFSGKKAEVRRAGREAERRAAEIRADGTAEGGSLSDDRGGHSAA